MSRVPSLAGWAPAALRGIERAERERGAKSASRPARCAARLGCAVDRCGVHRVEGSECVGPVPGARARPGYEHLSVGGDAVESRPRFAPRVLGVANFGALFLLGVLLANQDTELFGSSQQGGTVHRRGHVRVSLVSVCDSRPAG